MNKLTLLCLFSTFTFYGAYGEGPSVPQMGELITSVYSPTEYAFGHVEMRDKDLIVYGKRNILIYDQSGQKKKDVPIRGHIALKDGGFIGYQYPNDLKPGPPTYSIYNHEGNLKTTLVLDPSVGFLRQLRDESILVSSHNSSIPLAILDSEGKAKLHAKGSHVEHMNEFRDGTLVYSTLAKGELQFIGRDLKPKATHVFPPESQEFNRKISTMKLAVADSRIMKSYFGIRHLLVSRSELFLVGYKNQLFFYDSSGKEKIRFSSEDPRSLFVGATEFPDGEIFVNSTDGRSYIFDKEGKLIGKHQHDSKTVSPPVYAGKNLVVFQNSTELVFVDKEGKEKGVLPIRRTIDWTMRFPNLFSPEEGSILIHDLLVLHFIKF